MNSKSRFNKNDKKKQKLEQREEVGNSGLNQVDGLKNNNELFEMLKDFRAKLTELCDKFEIIESGK